MEILGGLVLADQPSVAIGKKLIVGDGVSFMASGPTASRPVAGISGSIYLDTTTSTMYYDDGLIWSVYGSTEKPSAYVSYGASTGTTLILADATVPLSTEGTQLCSTVITPSSTASKISIHTSLFCDCGTTGRSITFALFRGTTCIKAINQYMRTLTQPMTVSIIDLDLPATTLPVTYSLRVGVNQAATWSINRNSTGTVTYGNAVNQSVFLVREI